MNEYLGCPVFAITIINGNCRTSFNYGKELFVIYIIYIHTCTSVHILCLLVSVSCVELITLFCKFVGCVL